MKWLIEQYDVHVDIWDKATTIEAANAIEAQAILTAWAINRGVELRNCRFSPVEESPSEESPSEESPSEETWRDRPPML